MLIEPSHQPLSLTSQLDIILPSSPKSLPTSSHNPAETLSPTARLDTALQPFDPSSDASDNAKKLAALADAMDVARVQLNQHLTSWKDWIGKEINSSTGLKPEGGDEIEQQRDDGDDEDEEEEEGDEE